MQGDAVHTYHWMTSAQFLDAVALGQITPGPVVATVAAVGYAAHGVAGAALAALVAFAPSFVFVLIGGGQFERIRSSARAQAFLGGAGPAAIGAILARRSLLRRRFARGGSSSCWARPRRAADRPPGHRGDPARRGDGGGGGSPSRAPRCPC